MKKWRILTEERLEHIIQERLTQASREAARNYERDILMKQASIQTLQNQINPHFLYNALECIRGQALIDGSGDIAAITQALSHFFRYSISGKSDLVTLKDELENVNSYISIQKFRFRDRFRYQMMMDDEDELLLDAVLPKLTLQPVVENAIIHGFSQMTAGGELKIRILKIDRHVSVVVSDNGRGMDAETLERFTDSIRVDDLPAGERERRTGIGMQNVDRRIELYFGEEYGLGINSCPGMGTDVELFFPFCLSVQNL